VHCTKRDTAEFLNGSGGGRASIGAGTDSSRRETGAPNSATHTTEA
jgi:hypothetical protein